MILVVDNYDSFTYNLVQYLGELGAKTLVRKNDEISVAEARALPLQAVLISPGPGDPKEAGVSSAILQGFVGVLPILGVCLGHQCLGALWGGSVRRAARPMHGKASLIYHDGETIYEGLPNPFWAGRYHSLLLAEEGLSPEVEISARSEEGEIMGLRRRGAFAEGVQFHPESILTPEGKRLLANFLRLAGIRDRG